MQCRLVLGLVVLSVFQIRSRGDDVPLRARLGIAARERVLRQFTSARLTQELVRLYARVLPDCSR